MSIRVIERVVPTPRVETGAVQFSADWPGLFVRGDDCFKLKDILESCGATWHPFVKELIAAINEAHGVEKDGAE